MIRVSPRRLACGLFHPATKQICVELVMPRNRRNRHARPLARCNHLGLELSAIAAAATPVSRRLFFDSVHVSTYF